MKRIDTSKFAFWVVAFFLLFFVESAFFHNGNIVFVLLGAGLLYYGSRKRSKWMFVLGVIFIVMALLTLWSLRLLIFMIIIYILVNLWKGVPSEEIMRPFKEFQKETPNGIWKNNLFSIQSSPFSSYEWEDIQIQGIFGDIHIDLTDTVLPKGASFIAVRQGIGKIKIELPYEIPVRIHYTSLLGDAKIFDITRKRLINESLYMKDSYEGKRDNDAELIISLSTWLGDIEVTRK